MSLATVYKALKTLVEVELIQEINVGEGNFRYDGNSNDHCHVQCLACGRVDDLENLDYTHLNEEAQNIQTIEYFQTKCISMEYVKNVKINMNKKEW